MRARADFFAPDFTASQNWRGQWGPKTNFFRKPFIGKNYFLPAFDLTLDLFRTIGQAGEKLLSLAKQNNGGARYLPLDGKRRIKLKIGFSVGGNAETARAAGVRQRGFPQQHKLARSAGGKGQLFKAVLHRKNQFYIRLFPGWSGSLPGWAGSCIFSLMIQCSAGTLGLELFK